MLTGLQDSTTYEVYVRLVCSNGSVGELSDGVQLALVDASKFFFFFTIQEYRI